jgi:hypothetical protein
MQATVLVLVPYQAQEEDVEVSAIPMQDIYISSLQVVIERNHLLVAVRGQPPILKVSGLSFAE